MTKLYPLPGFESFDIGRVGHWCPVKTGCTYETLYDSNPSTSNNGTLTSYTDLNAGWVGSQYGTVRSYNGSNQFDSLGLIPTTNITSLTISAWVFFDSIPGAGSIAEIFGKWGNNAAFDSTDAFVLSVGLAQGLRFFIGGPNAGVTTGSAAVTTNVWYHVAAVWSQNIGRIFVDGVQQASGTITSSTMNSAASIATRIGRSNSSTGIDVGLTGRIAEINLWLNLGLNPGQITQSFQAGPGGMWTTEPPSRRYATLLANAYTLIAASASYSITGQPVGLLAGRLLTADAASYLFTGNTTGLNAGRMLTADSAVYSLTGQDANLLAGRLLSGDTATYNLIGNAANLLASRVLQANSAQYTVTGSDAALLAGRLLDCRSSAFLLSPNQAGLLAARKLTADQASILLSTQATSLYAGRKITADTAQFILIASPVDLTFGGGGAAPYYYLFLLGGSR